MGEGVRCNNDDYIVLALSFFFGYKSEQKGRLLPLRQTSLKLLFSAFRISSLFILHVSKVCVCFFTKISSCVCFRVFFFFLHTGGSFQVSHFFCRYYLECPSLSLFETLAKPSCLTRNLKSKFTFSLSAHNI